jgi:16S rRNA (adenine1518-N6/adenine1519-N6)-dimethyltransferase
MSLSRRTKLGQHFLEDSRWRRHIVDWLDLRPEDLVIEIGPGKGAMTELLAQRAARVIGIELDSRLAQDLACRSAPNPKIEIRTADILKINLTDVCQSRQSPNCFVFGNLPYYITSPILHHVLSFSAIIRSMALLVQREVADRLEARPGSRDYGYLSVFVQSYSEPRIVLTVPPGAFRPAPRVHSALVRFEMRLAQKAPPPEFFEFAKRCFAHKRKKLVGNLAPLYGRHCIEGHLSALGLPITLRAEQMSLEQFKSLFARLRSARGA